MKLAITFLMLAAAAASVQAVMRCVSFNKKYGSLKVTAENSLFGTTSRKNSEATLENLAATCKKQCKKVPGALYYNGEWQANTEGNRKTANCLCYGKPVGCEVPNSLQKAKVGSVCGKVVCPGEEDCIRRDMKYTGMRFIVPKGYEAISVRSTTTSQPPPDKLAAICKKQCKGNTMYVSSTNTGVDTTAGYFSGFWNHVSGSRYTANCVCWYMDLPSGKIPGVMQEDGYVCGRMECEGFDYCPKPVLTDKAGFTYATNCDCRPDSVQICIKKCVLKYPSCGKGFFGFCGDDEAVKCGQKCLSAC